MSRCQGITQSFRDDRDQKLKPQEQGFCRNEPEVYVNLHLDTL